MSMEGKPRIVFVDDEADVLAGLRRSLTSRHKEWEMRFFESPGVALDDIADENAHVVVTDMCMPEMTGAEFLTRVAAKSPETVRMVLTGNGDFSTAMAAVNQGHAFHILLKPCDHDQLVESLAGAIQQYRSQFAERRLWQGQIERTDKLQLIGQLAAGVVHDLNNILGVIALESQNALDGMIPESPVAAEVRRIQETVLDAAELTRELNGFSRCSPGIERLRESDVNELARTCGAMVQPMLKRNVALECTFSSGPLVAMVVPNQIKQVLLNLLINARDAIGGRGVIRIRTADVRIHRDQLVNHPGGHTGDYARIEVSDDGCGMDAAMKQHIGEIFYTTKEIGKGTGLGLYMAFRIVKEHRGWIEVDSAPGSGTTFVIYLPREAPPRPTV